MLSEILKNHNDFAAAYTKRGLLRIGYSNREAEWALADFQKAVNLNRQESRAYAGMAEVYRQMGKIKKACENYFLALGAGYPETVRFSGLCDHR